MSKIKTNICNACLHNHSAQLNSIGLCEYCEKVSRNNKKKYDKAEHKKVCFGEVDSK